VWFPARWRPALAGLTLLGSLALLIDAWQARSWRRLVTGGLALGVPLVVLTGWWFVRNVQLYGDPLANSAVKAAGGALPAAERFTNLPAKLTWFFDGILGCGPIGPLSLCFSPWVYAVAAVVALVGVAGVLRLLAQAGRRAGWLPARRRETGPRTTTLLWLTHAVLILGTLAAAVSFGFSLNNGWQGRYLFPAYTSLALFLVAGLWVWFPARWRPALAGLTLLGSLALSGYALFGMIIPRYGLPPSPSAAELRQATPLDAQIGGVARVLAYRVQAATVHPGGVLAVSVYWQPLARTATSYTVFLHLYSVDAGSITQRDTYPGLGNDATDGWDPNRVFVDTYRLYLPDDAPAGQHDLLLLGLYDAGSGERLPVTGKDAGPPEDAWVQFGDIAVQ